jgi:hypothetical protein
MCTNKNPIGTPLVRTERHTLSLLIACLLGTAPVHATSQEKEELLKLKNTTLNLIDMLVEQGVLDKNKAANMVKHAEKKAADEARVETQKEDSPRAVGGGGMVTKDTAESNAIKSQGPVAGAKGPVRVTYVPDFVKDEIRADVRKQLKEEVVREVKADAKNEQWGIPAALPDWVSRIKPFADVRLRFEDQFFGSQNQPNTYYNWPLINAKGGLPNTPNPYINTTQDRQRFRVRARFGAEAPIVEGLKANFRVSTSNEYSPISTNQTIGNYGYGYIIQLDRAFLQYDYLDDQGHDWFTLWGGRTPNPWFSTDNMYYSDVSMEGFSGTFRLPFGQDDPEIRGYNAPNTAGRLWFQNLNQGFTKPNEVYLTGGFFPLQEIWQTSHDKFMVAGQLGFDWLMMNNSRLKTGVAYYSYHNTQARQDPLGSTENDWTAPQFFTQGNSVARISNDLDPATEPRLVGLASQFNILDIMAQYDYTGFAPNHILLTGNYSKNLGFNQQQIYNTLGEDISPETQAYQIRLDVGRPDMLKLGDWNAWAAYKYLQRDSVMDAFTDANFHNSGTNAKGYVLGVNYGLANNVWANLRWLSSSIITGPSYDVDVLLADINARF